MFNPLQEILDMNLDWLAANGWTLRGNLAYRHILYEYNHSGIPSQRKIIEIIKKYDAEKQTHKIIEALKALVELKDYLRSLV
jgi:hypothetical protein